jgi:hypothetical protein
MKINNERSAKGYQFNSCDLPLSPLVSMGRFSLWSPLETRGYVKKFATFRIRPVSLPSGDGRGWPDLLLVAGAARLRGIGSSRYLPDAEVLFAWWNSWRSCGEPRWTFSGH